MQSPFITVICFDTMMNGVALGDRLGSQESTTFIGFGYHLHFLTPRSELPHSGGEEFLSFLAQQNYYNVGLGVQA